MVMISSRELQLDYWDFSFGKSDDLEKHFDLGVLKLAVGTRDATSVVRVDEDRR
jgi:hypothetical protein